MRTVKCQFCRGTGVNQVVGNPDAFTTPSDEHFDARAQPSAPCEECGGSGKDLSVCEPVKHTKSLRYAAGD